MDRRDVAADTVPHEDLRRPVGHCPECVVKSVVPVASLRRDDNPVAGERIVP
jgi:hypothetical protein